MESDEAAVVAEGAQAPGDHASPADLGGAATEDVTPPRVEPAPTERELVLRLADQFRAEPDVRKRATMLGVNWDGLRTARSRLLVGAWLIAIVVGVVPLIQPVLTLETYANQEGAHWSFAPYLLPLALGFWLAFFPRQISILIARSVATSPLREWGWQKRAYVAQTLNAAAFPVLVLVLSLLILNPESRLGMISMAPFAALAQLRPVTVLPLLIARGLPSSIGLVQASRKLPVLASLLGYRVRWIVADYCALAVSAASVTVLALLNGWLVIPVALFTAGVGVASLALVIHNRPRIAVVIALAAALLLAVLAVLFTWPSAAGVHFVPATGVLGA
jgi:hypothetical protein